MSQERVGYMKKIFTAAIAAAGVFLGTLTASADTLPLPRGETLDLGAAVSVYDGQDSFFGAKMYEWMADKESVSKLGEAITKLEIYPKEDTRRPRELAMALMETLRGAKLFQIRTETADTYYQEFVISVPLSDKNKLAMIDLITSAKPVKNSEPKELIPMYEKKLYWLTHQFDVTSHTDWKEGITKSGHSYRFGEAKVVFRKDNFTLPLTLTGYTTSNDDGTVYTIFIGDQSSAAYFAPIVKKAMEGIAR